MKRALLCAVLVAPAFASSPASWAEDVWDRAGSSDDSALSENELAPGSSQVHDLEATGGIMDQDWYRISQKPFSSYEVVVDGTTAGVGVIPVVSPGDELGVSLTPGTPSMGLGASGAARVLYFRNDTAFAIDNQQIWVGSPACGTTCGADKQYTIRFLDTTYSVPRFNNSSSQTTILIIQNSSFRIVFFNAFFFSSSGTLLGTYAANIPAQGAVVLNTSTVPGVGGASGSIIVSNDGRYGALAGKAVALEPTTGFTFDTAMVPRNQ